MRTSCRAGGGTDLRVFLDLGEMPLADALVAPEHADSQDPRFPLRVAFCPESMLVQIVDDVEPSHLFVDNYLYFSSFSPQLLEHSAEHARGLVASRSLGPHSLVVEIASNDGYFLGNLVDAGIPVLGIDPAPTQAAAARERGVPTLEAFFDDQLAASLVAEGRRADVIVANNVMAHVPDLDAFVGGMATLLAPDGVITVENPNVLDLVERCAFDTVYHEHMSYFSCLSVERLVRRHGLWLNDVDYFEDLHAGTCRWWISRHPGQTERLEARLKLERDAGVDTFEFYADFGLRVARLRDDLVALLVDLAGQGRRLAAYGAAAKGATLLNYAGLGTDLIPFVVDRNVHKQGLLMPGTHQPILAPDALIEREVTDTLLLTWNFADEIIAQQADYVAGGGRFVVPVPDPVVIGG